LIVLHKQLSKQPGVRAFFHREAQMMTDPQKLKIGGVDRAEKRAQKTCQNLTWTDV
jgi:hypothetical protein